MDQKNFIQEFESSIFGEPQGSLTLETKFKELAEWDSVAILNIIGFIDIEFNTQIGADKILQCNTIDDVYRLAKSGANS